MSVVHISMLIIGFYVIIHIVMAPVQTFWSHELVLWLRVLSKDGNYGSCHSSEEESVVCVLERGSQHLLVHSLQVTQDEGIIS